MSPLKFPIGVESFEKMREGGYAYADKTEVIYRLVTNSNCVFLSRPRRFGKSLTLSTIQAYFEGRKELFEGLWLGEAEGVDWTPRAVLRLNFVSAVPNEASLKALVEQHLAKWERDHGVAASSLPVELRFYNVIEQIYEKTGRKVVVLIDEYDKVLVNTLHDEETHELMKSILKPLYSVLKRADNYIEFAMLTGVSRFSKLSLFSDLNNLEDISFDNRYCTICGLTEDELRRYFGEGIESFAKELKIGFDEMMQILKQNYDGYHFSKICPDIYNPFSLVNALSQKSILHRWFESGTPTFLLERIRNSDEDIRELLSPVVSARVLMNTSIADNNLINILYQTGYLTIKSYDAEMDEYTLGLPNREVSVGVYENLLPFYTGRDVAANDNVLRKIRRCINGGDADGFVSLLQSYMAGIPYTLTENKSERYFENNLFVILSLLGFEISTEVETSAGRIDAVLKTPKYIYILELKLNGTAEEAMEQIRRKRYDLPYRADGRQIICLGISFSKETRTIHRWIVVPANL